jgi:hypothetical protein
VCFLSQDTRQRWGAFFNNLHSVEVQNLISGSTKDYLCALTRCCGRTRTAFEYSEGYVSLFSLHLTLQVQHGFPWHINRPVRTD